MIKNYRPIEQLIKDSLESLPRDSKDEGGKKKLRKKKQNPSNEQTHKDRKNEKKIVRQTLRNKEGK